MPLRPALYHRVAHLWGVDVRLLNHKSWLLRQIAAVAQELNLTVVKKFVHQFEPHGISIVLVLAESHLAIHTWPELGYLHLDALSCSQKANLRGMPKVLKKYFHPTIIKCHQVS